MPIPIESHNTSTGEIRYGPANVRVRGVSQYNADQIAFEGIEGFWQLPKSLQDKGAPKDGTILCVWLKTKPKSDRRARPGSRYMDIVTVKREDPDLDITTDGLEHADGQPYESPRDAYSRAENTDSRTFIETPYGPYYPDAKDGLFEVNSRKRAAEIHQGQAVNVIAALVSGVKPTDPLWKHLEELGFGYGHAVEVLKDSLDLLMAGHAPFRDDSDARFDADGNEVQPTQSGFDGEQHPPQPAEDAEEVEELPW